MSRQSTTFVRGWSGLPLWSWQAGSSLKQAAGSSQAACRFRSEAVTSLAVFSLSSALRFAVPDYPVQCLMDHEIAGN